MPERSSADAAPDAFPAPDDLVIAFIWQKAASMTGPAEAADCRQMLGAQLGMSDSQSVSGSMNDLLGEEVAKNVPAASTEAALIFQALAGVVGAENRPGALRLANAAVDFGRSVDESLRSRRNG